MMYSKRKSQHGFTLVEMIVVIVITGILGGVVAVFLRAPVQGYVDSARRAELVDIADTALRRIGRDLRTAVPNSIRVPAPAGSQYIEFLPTTDGGRYRADPTGGAGGCAAVAGNVDGDALSFAVADTCFEVVGPPITLTRGTSDNNSDQIVVGSTQADGNPPYQAPGSATGVRRAYNGPLGTAATTAIKIVSPAALPAFAELPDQRFDVVPGSEQAVTYSCENVGTAASGDGTGTLKRYWGYGFNVTQAAPPLGGSNALLASGVSACNIVYDNFSQRAGLVAITLQITRGGEAVRLYHEIHVNNEP